MNTLLGLSYVAAFITAVVGTYLAESLRKKNLAEAAEALTNSAIRLLEESKSRVAELEAKNKELERLCLELQTKNAELDATIVELRSVIAKFKSM